MTEDEKRILHQILDGQQILTPMIIDMQARLNALERVLCSLDSRVPQILPGEIEKSRELQRALLEHSLKDIALLRATVSKTVQ
jgi:hypothetical protein